MSGKLINKFLLLRVAWAVLFAGSTRVFYDRIASLYDRVFLDHIIHIETMGSLLSNIYPRKNCTILDLGCGTGMLSKALADQGFRVIGLDVSMESLLAFKRTDHRVALIQNHAESLPFSDHCFQALVCLGVWRHLSHFEVVLDEICRVISEDGKFILGYFPPKLGGVYRVPENRWGKIFVFIYKKMIQWFGYEDFVDFGTEKKTLYAICKRFDHVRKINSGEHWYLILASRPHAKLTAI